MVYEGIIEGRYIDLKSVQESDAEFTLKLRQDPEIIKYLPELNNTIEQQRNWIRRQRQKKDDYFFVVYDKEGNPIGTYGIYDIRRDSAESGRLAMRGNAMQNFEVQLLVYKFVFDKLGVKYIYGYIYTSNKRNQRFNLQFGAELEETSIEMYGTSALKCVCRKDKFIDAIPTIERFLYREK